MKIIKHAPGTACWLDLSTSDVEGAKRFYADVFGWVAREVEQPDAGGYSIFYRGDERVAAVAPHMSEGQPTVWTVYFATEDSDATMAKVEAAGGKVMFAPVDIYTEGRMALYFDPEGTVFAAWEPRNMPGTDLIREPGSLTWVELMSRDAEGAKRFYGSVFGWTCETSEMGGGPYTLWQVPAEKRPLGGMIEMAGEPWPADLPTHWMPYIEVADCDATAELVIAGGGMVGVEPTTITPGRFAVCGDPQGAFFSILASAPTR